MSPPLCVRFLAHSHSIADIIFLPISVSLARPPPSTISSKITNSDGICAGNIRYNASLTGVHPSEPASRLIRFNMCFCLCVSFSTILSSQINVNKSWRTGRCPGANPFNFIPCKRPVVLDRPDAQRKRAIWLARAAPSCLPAKCQAGIFQIPFYPLLPICRDILYL